MKYLTILLIFLSLNAKADITAIIGTGQKSDYSLQNLNQSGSQSVYSLEALYLTQDNYLLGAEYINYKDTKLLKVGYAFSSKLSVITGAGIRTEDQITGTKNVVTPATQGSIPQIQTINSYKKQNVTVLWPIEILYRVDKINLGAEILSGDTYQFKLGWTF